MLPVLLLPLYDDVLLAVVLLEEPRVLLAGLDVVVVVADGDGQRLLGLVLLDHVPVQVGLDVLRPVVELEPLRLHQ